MDSFGLSISNKYHQFQSFMILIVPRKNLCNIYIFTWDDNIYIFTWDDESPLGFDHLRPARCVQVGPHLPGT